MHACMHMYNAYLQIYKHNINTDIHYTKNNYLKIRFSSVSEGGEKNKSFCTAGGAVTSSSLYRKQYGFPSKQPKYKYNNTRA